MEKSKEEIEAFYKNWCKETKRSGGILIGSSIKELLFAYHSQFTQQGEQIVYVHDTINNEVVEVGSIKEAEKYAIENFTEGNEAHPDYWGFDLFIKIGTVDENCKVKLSSLIK